ncbi:MAG: cytochrome ubiquinol oxidase subunit I, partial [Rhodoferax sp.]|nr:cytochrome ubiquinol oxidase subunit I [Rhodoferax sp.]
VGAWRLRRGHEIGPWLARVLVSMTFAGWVALIAGWYVTEIGRQPWLVTGVLTSADAASTVPAGNIALTLSLYLVLYVVLLASYVRVVFYLAGKARDKSRPLETSMAVPTGFSKAGGVS